MPPVDQNVILAKKRRKPSAPRNADTGDTARSRPVTPRPSPAFTRPVGERPFARQQRTAQVRVDRSRRRLPQAPVAQPPVIRNPTRQQTQAARAQVVRSIRQNTVGLSGAERQEYIDRLMREVRTDPRYRRTAAAIGDVRARERLTARPQTRAELRAGPGDRILGAKGSRAGFLPDMNLSEARRLLERATPGLQAATAEGAFTRNALKDVGTIASAPFVGALGVADVATDLATGRPDEAWRKTREFAEGTVKGIVHDWSDPVRYFREHPLLFALDVGGATSVAGRTAGAVARGVGSTADAGGVRGALARGGSTVRPPIALTDDPATGGVVERTYSKDVTRKGAQVAADASREPLRDASGKVVTTTIRGREVPVLRPRSETERARLARRRGDFAASRANLLERAEREEAAGDSAVMSRPGAALRRSKVPGVRGRAARDVVAMVAEGTVRSAGTFAADLRSRLKVVRDELAEHDAGRGSYRHEVEVEAARREVQTIERVLNSPRALAQADRIVEAGVELARRQVRADEENVRAGLIPGGQAARRRLAVPALAHQGARYFSEEEHAAAEATARAAGNHTLADEVSGRDPVKVRAHRKAQQDVSDARTVAQRAAAEQARLEGKVRRLAGAQSVQRGQGKVPDHILVGRMSAARRSAKAARARRRKAEKDLRRAQHVLRQTPEPKRNAGLRDKDGRYLSNADIETALRAAGRDPGTVAALPHRQDTVGSSAYHSRFAPGGRPTMDKPGEVFTGSAYKRGAQGTTAELLKEQGVRQRVQLSKARQVDRLVGDHGMRHPAWAKAQRGDPLNAHERRVVDGGGYFTGPEAKEVIDRAAARNERLVAVTAYPARLDETTAKIVRDNYQGPAGMEALGQRLLNSRVLTDGDLKQGRRRNVVLMNADLVDRLNKHLTPSGGPAKFGQVLNKAFRYAVLPQPRWLTGEFVEPFMVRLPVVGSGVTNVFGLVQDVRAANKMLKTMDRSGDPRVRAAGKEIRAQQVANGLLFGVGASQRRGLSDFPVLQGQARKAYARMVQRMPATRQLAEVSGMLLRGGGKAILAPLQAVFAIGRATGASAQRVAFGRQVRRDIQEFTGSWVETVKLGQKAMDEVARGLVNTSTQERFTLKMYETLGKYDGFSPTMRAIVQGPAPFIPWALNAARFTMWTMPAHHTALTALLVRMNDVMAKDWEEIHKPVAGLKGGLQLAVPNGKGGWVDISRYTPWGLSGPVAKGDPRALTSQFFPQISGATAAVEGKDPFGRPMVTSDGKRGDDIPLERRLLIALNSGAEATVPYLGNSRRLREHGETAFADSTILDPRTKPGTSHGMSAARRVFDPLRPTYVGAAGAGQASEPTEPASAQQPQTGGVPASVQRALDRIQVEQVDAIPPSVQRALERIR